MREGIHRILTTLNRMFHSIRNHFSDKPIMIFDPIYQKRNFLILLILMGGVSVANAQVILWQEEFNYSNGTPENPPWTIDYDGRGRFDVQDGRLEAFHMDGMGEWESEVIDISSSNYVEVTMDISWFGGGGFSDPDIMRVYYKVDGGDEVLFYENILTNAISSGGSAALTKVIKGSALQLIIRTYNDYGQTGWPFYTYSYNSFDNIVVKEVKTFYSFANGNWNDGNRWSVHPFDHPTTRQAAGEVPTANEGAIIGNNNNITINVNNAGLSFLEVIDNGTLTMSGRSLSMHRGGGITVKDGGKIHNNGTIIFRDNADTDMTIDTPNGLTVGTLTLQEGLKLNIKGTGNGTISGNVQFSSPNNTIDLNCPLTINGDISSSSNTNQLINKSSITLGGQIASNIRLFSNYPGSGFNYARGGNQTIITPEDAYHHLSLSGSGTKSTAGNFSINGDLNITGSATLSYNNTISLAGDFNNLRNSTSTLTGNGTFIFNGSGNQTYTSPAALTFSNLGLHKTGGNLTLQHNMTSTGTATVRNTNRIESSTGIQLTFATLNFPVTNALLDLNVNTTISGNITLSAANNQLINRKELTLTGNFPTTTQVFTVTNSENSTVNWGGGTAPGSGFRLYSNSLGAVFNYNRTNAQPIILPQDAYHHLTLSGSGNKTTNGNFSINGNINITESAVLSYGHTISLAGDFINNRNNTGAVTTPTTGSRTLIFNGSGNQTYTSPVNLTFLNIGLNKTGGRLVLERQLAISGSMAFINGVVETTSTNLLIFNSGATQTGSHNNSYVEGPVRKLGNQDFTFPVGDGGIYAPIRISSMQNGAGDTHFTAQYHNQPAPFPNQKETDFSHVSGAEYWDLSRTYDAGNNARCYVHLYWMDADRSEIIQPSDLIVAHYNSQTSKWERFNAQESGNSIKSDNRITSFSPFTFGSINGINPLPVEFLSFSGTSQKNGNLLKWQTATEHNNDYFSVEKSKDGKEWSACGQVAGNGDSFTTLSYSYLDQQAAYGVTYYRLKQVDFNGEYDYSSIISVNNSNIPQFSTERAYPNPTNGELMVRYTTPEYGQITLTIQNLQAQPVVRKVLNAEAGSHTIEMDIAGLANGLYLLIIQQNQNQVVERIVKQ